MAGSALDEGQTPPAGWSQPMAINTAEVLTIVLLLVLAAVVGVQDMRQVVYLSLPISYCARRPRPLPTGPSPRAVIVS